MNYTDAKRLFSIVAFVVVLIAATIYGGDYLWLRLRIQTKNPGALGSVTVFYAITLKNGRVEVFYDQPHTQTCVHSLFPHLRYTPCWYLNRQGHNIKQISLLATPPKQSETYTSRDGPRQKTV